MYIAYWQSGIRSKRKSCSRPMLFASDTKESCESFFIDPKRFEWELYGQQKQKSVSW